MPYTIVRKAGIRLVRFRVETIPGRIGLDVAEERSFLDSVVDHFRQIRADVIIPGSTNAVFRTYPKNAVAAPYGTHVVALTQEEQALWSSMSATHRRHVRSASKSGVTIRTDFQDLHTVHSIIRNTFRKSDLPFMSVERFLRLVDGLEGQVHVIVAERDGRVQCCAVIAFSQHSAYYIYGGSVADAAPGSMHLLHWEAMRLCRGLGVRRYDFVGTRVDPAPGSKAEGLAIFKQRFGAELIRGYLWKCPLNALRAATYTIAVRCLRGGDIVDAERHKLRGVAS